MCVQSIIVTILYLHSLVYIPLQLFQFSQFFFFLFFLWNIIQNWSSSVPEYFEDHYILPNCNSIVKELTQAVAQHKDWLMFIFWELTLSYQLTTWSAD
jgi:hypothetical protein